MLTLKFFHHSFVSNFLDVVLNSEDAWLNSSMKQKLVDIQYSIIIMQMYIPLQTL